MKTITNLIVVFFLFSCNLKSEKVKGDLFFKLINVMPSSGMYSNQAKKTELMLDSLSLKNEDSKNTYIFKYFIKLRKLNLLKTPFINLKIEDNYKQIFLTDNEYEKVKSFNLRDLQKQNKKVSIELNIKELDSGIYFSDKILEVVEIEGLTPWKK